MIWLYVILGVLGFLFVLFIATLIFVYVLTFYTPFKIQNDDFRLTEATQFVGQEKFVYELIISLKKRQCNHIYTTSFDKKELHARFYPNEKSNTYVIMFHGYRGTAYRDFSGGAAHMIDSGYNVILVDERGHGESQGHSITFGNREKRDVLTWINYAKKVHGNDIEIILVGISMGAATVLFAAQYVPVSIKIICDCPYSTPKEIICETLKKLNLPVKIFYPLLNFVLLLFAHSSLNKDDASESVKKSNHKVLIIHGDKDTVVPHRFSYRIYQENKEKVRYELFPNTDHGVSYLTDTKRYLSLIDDFLKD